MRRKGRIVYVHRRAYERYYGRLDPGQRVYHECEDRACVNPWHLTTERPDPTQRRRPATAKLSPRQVRAIRRAWAEPDRPTQATLASKYGVSRSCISLVVRRVTWADV